MFWALLHLWSWAERTIAEARQWCTLIWECTRSFFVAESKAPQPPVRLDDEPDDDDCGDVEGLAAAVLADEDSEGCGYECLDDAGVADALATFEVTGGGDGLDNPDDSDNPDGGNNTT